MNTSAMIEALKKEGFLVIEKFDGSFPLVEITPDMVVKKAAVLDTETTGKDALTDKIIEMGIVVFEYDRNTRQILRVVDSYSGLEDPLMPIDPAATAVNGITDDMVKGKKLDDSKIENMLSGCSFVIAHNSSFDRVFCERRMDVFKQLPWACSRSQIDWEAESIGSQKLDYISYKLGFHYEAHRAEMDCLALLRVIASTMPVSGKRGMDYIAENFFKKTLRVYALNSAFETKDALSKKGYRWSAGLVTEKPEKAWYIELEESELEEEIEWLRKNIYSGKKFTLRIDTLDAYSRFSSRVSSTVSKYC